MKKSKAKSRKGGISKSQKIRKMFTEKESWTVAELVKRSGFDERNVRTAMSIFKNPKRTKDPLVTNYDPETKAYMLKKGI